MGIDNAPTFSLANTASIDAFARLRVSNPATLFDGKLLHPGGTNQWDDQEVSGSGTSSSWSTDSSTQLMGLTATTAGKRTRQSKRRFNYQSGKSQQIMMSFCGNDIDANVKKRVGYFDDANGIYLVLEDGVAKIVRRSSSSGSMVETKVAQSDWNIDVLDGKGRSGKVINWATDQILFIDLEWLGVGRVRIGLVLNGEIVFFHDFNHANIATTTYMGTPNLPLRYEIEGDGTQAASSLLAICGMVASEGGQDEIGDPRGVYGSATSLATGTTYALCGIRHQSSYIDAVIRLIDSWVGSTDKNNAFRFHLIINPTLGAAPSWASVTTSPMEAFVGGATFTVTNGTRIYEGVSVGQAAGPFDPKARFYPGVLIDGTRDILTLCATPITNSIDIHGSINWIELG